MLTPGFRSTFVTLPTQIAIRIQWLPISLGAVISETQRNLFNKRACVVSLTGAFVLLVALFFAFRPSPIETQSVTVIEPSAARRVDRPPPRVFDAEAFKRTIIDNNLFRPLGWRPPRPVEPYRLIGTLIPTDANTPKRAILQRTTARTTDTVSIGDKLDADTCVVDIQPKEVTLEKDGVQRKLHLNTTPLLK